MDFNRRTSSSRGVSDRDALLVLEALLALGPALADSPEDTLLITSRSSTTLRAYASTAAWGLVPAVSSLTASWASESAATRALRDEGRDPDWRGGETGDMGPGAGEGEREGLPPAVELPDELDASVCTGSGGRLRLGGFIGRRAGALGRA